VIVPRPLREELRPELEEMAAIDFAHVGFRGASLDELAARAGVTKGAVYFHFRSKLDLFVRALDRLEQLREVACPDPSPENPPIQQLRGFLVARLDFHARHPELRRLHWILDTELADEPITASRDGIRAEHRSLRARIRQLLQSAARRGDVDLTDPAEEAFRLAACFEGSLEQQSAAPEDTLPFWDPERMVDGWLAPFQRRSRRRPDPRPAPRVEQPDEDFRPAF
jgi:TetR/AcrR family acrAB operon transcriptional repressor